MNSLEKIMACTVVSPTPRNKHWVRLQSNSLRANGITLDKYAVINGFSEDSGIWEGHNYGILANSGMNMGHGWGLAVVIDAFKNNDKYDWLLILDSDAWPVDVSWFQICKRMMAIKEKNGAAVIRYENFDTFPHPCVFLANRKLVNSGIEFRLRHQVSIFGESVTDLSLAYKDFDNELLPLTRSNKVNYHPLFGGVYSHIFYHHGAGSRYPGRTRLADSQMCDHYIKSEEHVSIESKMFEKMVNDYPNYIATLKHGVEL